MTEKLFTGTLNHNQNKKTKQKTKFASIHPFVELSKSCQSDQHVCEWVHEWVHGRLHILETGIKDAILHDFLRESKRTQVCIVFGWPA